MLKNFWINHQRFLLLCGGALVTFLIGNSLIANLAAGANSTYVECRRLRKQIVDLHRTLDSSYWDERDKLDAYSKHEKALVEAVCLAAPTEPTTSKSLLIELNRRIDATWDGVREQASDSGLQLPEKLTAQDFDIEPGEAPEQYKINFSYLGIVSQALRALVAAGMTQIDTPDLISEEDSPVLYGDEEVATCVYRGVSFPVVGSYDSFVKLLRMVQEPKAFLQVRLIDLAPVRATQQSLLGAKLEFYGLLIEYGEDSGTSEGPLGDEETVDGRRRLR